MRTLKAILFLLAVVCFVAAASRFVAPDVRVRVMALGLALFTLVFTINAFQAIN
jgi:hypothetical protein